jgi:hypothetical protein
MYLHIQENKLLTSKLNLESLGQNYKVKMSCFLFLVTKITYHIKDENFIFWSLTTWSLLFSVTTHVTHCAFDFFK